MLFKMFDRDKNYKKYVNVDIILSIASNIVLVTFFFSFLIKDFSEMETKEKERGREWDR